MTWSRLSDDFTDRPEILALSLAAGWLHVEAIVWCNKHLTDGQIPAAALGRLAGKIPDPTAAVAELVTQGVWEAQDGGWQLDWSDQETAQRVTGRRQYRAKVQADYRERGELHQRGDHSKCTEKCRQRSNSTGHVTGNGTGQLPLPVPSPSRPLGRDGKGKGNSASLDARASSANATERAASAQPGKNWDPATDWKLGPPPGVTVGMLPDTTDWNALERQAKEQSKLWGTP
ncbi:UNVERIFIED_ORG: hypothetical protein J2X79_000214 [Arthrobacter globiformis]|nr:hypothetical protein [Arthrobacter globiformis]